VGINGEVSRGHTNSVQCLYLNNESCKGPILSKPQFLMVQTDLTPTLILRLAARVQGVVTSAHFSRRLINTFSKVWNPAKFRFYLLKLVQWIWRKYILYLDKVQIQNCRYLVGLSIKKINY